MKNIGKVLGNEPLVTLVQKENFVGWVYEISYDEVAVMTNDLWKSRVAGVPHNCFLIATPFDPGAFQETDEADRIVLLLRVIDSARLPQDDDMVRARIDHFQNQRTGDAGAANRDMDDLTRNQMQFGGLKCRILGTFFLREGDLWLGSDIESFETAALRLNVHRPRGAALERIANHVDPLRRKAAQESAQRMGLKGHVSPFRIGTVRYTSTDRLHRGAEESRVPVHVQPSDFMARRTAVLGMTRTGKSNMVKQMVSVVKRVADEGQTPIGQIIFDINGEYANANEQDEGALADVYPDETVRYRMLQTKGFEELQNNFFIQLVEGFSLIRRTLLENKSDTASDVKAFVNTSLDEPDKSDRSAHKRWEVRVASYQTMLCKAGFTPPHGFKIRFEANKGVRDAVERQLGNSPGDPKTGLAPDDAIEWFTAADDLHRENQLPQSSSGKSWADDDTVAIWHMLTNRNESGAYINGYKALADARRYHSPRRSQEVGEEIYRHLIAGKIVILDLSVGEAQLRERISEQIARTIFAKSMNQFIAGNTPPNVVVYVEEAHNLIGKGMDLADTWPRMAKEGAKYRIALVYATQEVSSVHPNILANTENWFITHLNNETELKELGKFYDFADFKASLLRAQDVGFARVKTLSSPYVIPVQIDRFDP